MSGELKIINLTEDTIIHREEELPLTETEDKTDQIRFISDHSIGAAKKGRDNDDDDDIDDENEDDDFYDEEEEDNPFEKEPDEDDLVDDDFPVDEDDDLFEDDESQFSSL